MALMEEPLTPAEFPEYGKDILRSSTQDVLRKYISPGNPFPLLIKVKTLTGTVFAGVILQSPKESDLLKGFRTMAHVPWDRVIGAVKAKHVLRCQVERVDPRWVHGRDHNPDFDVLRSKRVAIVGCGAIGGAVARLLVQAGVMNLILVDPDELVAANTSRHLLGQQHLGEKKAEALAQALRRDFPHIESVTSYTKSVQDMSSAVELVNLGACNLVITAGVDLLGDDFVDRWRDGQEVSPAHLATWTEEFALASHAVLIVGRKRLLDFFDNSGHPTFLATNWSPHVARRFEAGCGNAFQPHGAADLNNAITIATQLALDFLLGRKDKSCRRVWLGDRDRVVALGGTPNASFSSSNVVIESGISE